MDEIGEMSLRMQALLLRFLESGEIQRVGTDDPRRLTSDVRVIAATNRRLLDRIKASDFREDLYYRLNVIHITIPPLKERRDDVEPLLHHFLRQFAAQHGVPAPACSPEALAALEQYDWPGNVRELRNIVERVVIMTASDAVKADDLPALGSPESVATPSRYNFASYREGRDTYERNYIMRKLAECDGNITRTAEAMGIDRSHLYRRMKSLGISDKRAAADRQQPGKQKTPEDGE
jgi:two-component system nitrogen regulation response regulator NtrX